MGCISINRTGSQSPSRPRASHVLGWSLLRTLASSDASLWIVCMVLQQRPYSGRLIVRLHDPGRARARISDPSCRPAKSPPPLRSPVSLLEPDQHGPSSTHQGRERKARLRREQIPPPNSSDMPQYMAAAYNFARTSWVSCVDAVGLANPTLHPRFFLGLGGGRGAVRGPVTFEPLPGGSINLHLILPSVPLASREWGRLQLPSMTGQQPACAMQVWTCMHEPGFARNGK